MRLKFIVHSNHSKLTRPQGTTPSQPRELKLGARELAAPLTKLYNSCISNGKWPCEWKKGVWSSIFKKDDPLDRENYRPTTVHFAMDKVLEQLVSEQITTKFDNYLEQCITA